MMSEPTLDSESADANKVQAAIAAISSGDLDTAEKLLLAVIANTPSAYSNSTEDDDKLSFKFWDQMAFVHYVTWQRHRGIEKSVTWILNAYPRAHYYMGFLCVKRKQFDRAIEYLDKAQSLDPTNPKIGFEKAQALMHSGRKEEALALYDQVTEVGPHVSALDLAVARRGRGFVLIEMGRLDDAENAFLSSLELEPGNEVTLGELAYIEHLREGGDVASIGVVTSTGPNPSTCAVCGRGFTKGVVVSLDGRPVSICTRCNGKLTKKWWQFWK